MTKSLREFKNQVIRSFADTLLTKMQYSGKPLTAEMVEQSVAAYEDIDCQEENEELEFRSILEQRNANAKKHIPEADQAVLQFITDLACCAAINEDEYEIIRSTFRAGYCWHFAHLLKNAFKRGEVCWVAPFGHFVWMDNGVAYDIEGVNADGEEIYNIPECFLGEKIKEFTHVPGEDITPATPEEIVRIIRTYENAKGLEHADLSYYRLGE